MADTRPKSAAVPERVAKRLMEGAVREGECLIAPGSTNGVGYCRVWWREPGEPREKNNTKLAHRVSWWIHNGEIPDGLVVDHMCRNRRCIEITHLRLLTNEENSALTLNANKQFCPQGHPYAGENLYVGPSGKGKWCRICTKNKWIRKKAAMAAERQAAS